MKHHINLYGAEFRPRRLWASLPQMSLVWGGVLLLLLAATLFYGWQQQGLDRELAGVRAQLDVQRGEARRLNAELARHQADAGLQQQLADKREELGAKQALMQQLGSLSLQKSRGYAGVMADLARLRDARLSLQRIEISDGRINLSGVAERSQDVPAWVNRFKQTPTLAGAQFGELTLSRDKEGRLAFQLSGIAREAP
ncbi:PilN domain-containing protein [Aeromonas sanarellii]|uniref:PilN domain-containing protein n=1 Tax=Aeromonas TaxID=642 RepID=UPI001C224B91|nr:MULTISPECIES: PilN domain-containing protein [Aeromonas]MEB6608129.1 PilN domain-containing protein [Aeromonas sanarellii]QXC31072.1 PilN domain-containing protein [Aeromonas sp. FDAARGOS 1409]